MNSIGRPIYGVYAEILRTNIREVCFGCQKDKFFYTMMAILKQDKIMLVCPEHEDLKFLGIDFIELGDGRKYVDQKNKSQ